MAFLLREIQGETFNKQWVSLIKKETLESDDPVSSLYPFIDSDEIIRVGGRLRHADLPFADKHPILLPSTHTLTVLIIRHYH